VTFLTYLALVAELGRFRSRERWSRDRLLLHQARAQRSLRSLASARSPFYRRFHRGLADRPLRELPVLTKATMMENFDDLVTDREIRVRDVERHLATLSGDGRYLGRYRVNATSGSIGRQGLFLFDRSAWVTVLASFIRAHQWAAGASSIPPRYRVASIVSPTPWHISQRAEATLRSTWTPSLRLLASDPLENLVAGLNEWQPSVLGAYPSILRALAQEQLAGRLRISPRYLYSGAEVLTAETRRRIAEAWGAGRLFDIYGATEGGLLAAECPRHTGLHLYEDLAIFEVVDDRNRPVPPGGYGDKLLITVLFNRVQPLIRYELSDSVRLSGRDCPCGRPFATIADIRGRVEEILRFPAAAGGEVSINPVVFDQVMDRLPGGEWQVVQERGGLSILLAGVPEALSDTELAEDVRRALETQGAIAPAITVKRVPAIPRIATGKAPLIRSELPRPSLREED